MPADDREQQFERALAQHMRNASPDAACPDAETLAAYHERTLSLEEMAQWKEHIAGCDRCRESLALVEQSEHVAAEEWENADVPVPVEELGRRTSEPVAAASLEPKEATVAGWPAAAMPLVIPRAIARARWRWIVPVGALAASIIVWVGVRESRMQNSRQGASVEIAQNRPAATQLPEKKPAVTDQLNERETRKEELPAQTPSPSPVPTARAQTAPSKRVPFGKVARTSPPATDATAALKPKDKELMAGGNAAPTVAESPLSQQDAKNEMEAPPAIAPSVSAVAGAAAGRLRAETKKAPGPMPPVQSTAQSQTVQTYNSTADLSVTARSQAGLLQVAAADRRYILVPGEKHAWRVGDAGKIERSTDGGSTWKEQNSGITADLTAGSATSDAVCWVAGKAGMLLLTIDGGKHWKRVNSPVAEDLGGIRALDATHALIWDASNRKSFQTSDGGATWTQVANE
jgi:hypothetical protein